MKPLPNRVLLTLTLALAALLTSCRTSRPRYVIGVSQCSNDAWREKMNNEMLTEALLYDDVSVEIRSAEDNNNRQIADIRSFIDRGVDLLVVAPNEAIPVTPVVEEAYASGIPVIVVDRKILSDQYTAYIGADNYRIGKVIGEYVAARLGRPGQGHRTDGTERIDARHRPSSGFPERPQPPFGYPAALQRGCPLAAGGRGAEDRFAVLALSRCGPAVRPQRSHGIRRLPGGRKVADQP